MAYQLLRRAACISALFMVNYQYEVRDVRFKPFVFGKNHQQIPVFIVPMTQTDAESTNLPPVWQTSWTSEHLAEERFEKYAAKVGDELIALGAYEIMDRSLVVHIIYMEAHPRSNPNLDNGGPNIRGLDG